MHGQAFRLSPDEVSMLVRSSKICVKKIHFSPHHLITIKLTRIKHFGKVQHQLCYYKTNMTKEAGRLVTQQNNCSAAYVYSIFGFSSNV